MDFPRNFARNPRRPTGWKCRSRRSLLWAREGKLLAAARTEGGQLLFYRWRVEHDGAALAAIRAHPDRAQPRQADFEPSRPRAGLRLSAYPRSRPFVSHRRGVARDGTRLQRGSPLQRRRQASGSHRVALPRRAVAAPDRSTREAANSSPPGGSCGRSRSPGRPRSGPPPHTGE